MNTVIYQPLGFGEKDDVTNMPISDLSNVSVQKYSNQREIFIAREYSKIFNGYAYLGYYLNNRPIIIDPNYDKVLTDDLLIIKTMPLDCFLLEVRYLAFVEQVSNYNTLNNNSLSVVPGFCETGTTNFNAITDSETILGTNVNYFNPTTMVQDCKKPLQVYEKVYNNPYMARYAFTAPVRSWMPVEYSKNDAEFCFKVTVAAGSQWQMHVWYTYWHS